MCVETVGCRSAPRRTFWPSCRSCPTFSRNACSIRRFYFDFPPSSSFFLSFFLVCGVERVAEDSSRLFRVRPWSLASSVSSVVSRVSSVSSFRNFQKRAFQVCSGLEHEWADPSHPKLAAMERSYRERIALEPARSRAGVWRFLFAAEKKRKRARPSRRVREKEKKN